MRALGVNATGSEGWRERLVRWSAPRADHSRSTMTLVLAAMAACATAIGCITFALPQVRIPDRPFQVGITLSGIPYSAAMLVLRARFGERLPAWLFHGLVAGSVVMICLGSWSARTSPTAVASLAFLVWIGLFVGSFFPLDQAVAHLCWIGGCLAVLLALNGDAASAAVGVLTFGIVLAATVASFFVSSELARVAGTDPLTGLPTRQYLDANLEREIARCERQGAPLSVGIVDLDFFKEINDSSGHLAGDAQLVSLAQRWRSQLRRIDLMARFGGDEFVVAFPNCDVHQAVATFERLRNLGSPVCSVGVAEWVHGDTREALLERADRALYSAKQTGRDRIVAAPAPRVANGLGKRSPTP